MDMLHSRLDYMGSFFGVKIIRSTLFHTSLHDPMTLALPYLLFLVVTMFACYFPAFRASRVDPMQTLREEECTEGQSFFLFLRHRNRHPGQSDYTVNPAL